MTPEALIYGHPLEYHLQHATPAMGQYFRLKFDHPDCLLFYRMGDFYELFFDDAKQASEILNIALTKRGKHGDEEVAMCGVPVHSHESYLEKLIASGVKVAICEQMENPAEAKKARGYKAIVNRDVVRVVTPGTITEDSLLASKESNFLAALSPAKDGNQTLGWVDLTSGQFRLQPLSANAQAEDCVLSLSPKELLIIDSDPLKVEGIAISPQPASCFDAKRGAERLESTFKLQALDSLGTLSNADLAAANALLNYLDLTQKGIMPRLEKPIIIAQHEWMVIDPATRRNLELTHSLQGGGRKGSLLHSIDRTVTAGGGRLLAERMAHPLMDKAKIDHRLNQIKAFTQADNLRQDIRETLKRFPDLERAISRICLGRGGPRDLLMIVGALDAALNIRELFDQSRSLIDPNHLQVSDLQVHDDLRKTLKGALQLDVPMLARDGNFIASGHHAALDEFRLLRDESKRLIASLQQDYIEETGITTLKIKFNNVLGYFVEITPTNEAKMTDSFVHRQTMKNALRYSSKPLAELEHKLSEAAGKALKLELECFDKLIEAVKGRVDDLAITARAIAAIDVAAANAHLAVECDYIRPELSDDHRFIVEEGRHPVVEQHLRKENASNFIGNDCQLSNGNSQNLWLLTGANMAGKSTFLRQNALIAIMAQMGCYVPASKAEIGMIDKLFSRVGAADDLARGRSTFMVEMVETATILNQATPQSFVILDEIGRGTATYDGMSIAWAVVEHLHHSTRCRGLFATHYHELTQLENTLPHLSCHYMKAREWKGDVIFLHQVEAGAGGQSYGIHVAKLAGLPASTLKRAAQLLKKFEEQKQEISAELPLFSLIENEAEPVPEHTPITEQLLNLDLNQMTPLQAHALLVQLQQLASDSTTPLKTVTNS